MLLSISFFMFCPLFILHFLLPFVLCLSNVAAGDELNLSFHSMLDVQCGDGIINWWTPFLWNISRRGSKISGQIRDEVFNSIKVNPISALTHRLQNVDYDLNTVNVNGKVNEGRKWKLRVENFKPKNFHSQNSYNLNSLK